MKQAFYWIGGILVVVAFFSAGYVWIERATLLPERVPTHWNAAGEPDQFHSRDDILWIMLLPPLVVLCLVLLAPLFLWLSPQHFDFEGCTRTFYHAMLLVVVLFSYLHFVLLISYSRPDIRLLPWMLAGLFGFLTLIGNVLGQVPRNFWLGIRVPWTLASAVVWTKTHRLAAWLWVAAGLLGLLLAVVGVTLWFHLALLAVMVFVPIGYSLWLYKKLERQGKIDLA